MERSDKYIWSACKRCGTLVAFNITHNINSCNNCNNDDVAVIQTPYAFKLFTQELEAMGIQMRINTKHIDMPVEQLYIERNDSDDEDGPDLDDIDIYDFEDDDLIKDERVWKEIYDFKEKIEQKGGSLELEADDVDELDVENDMSGGDEADEDVETDMYGGEEA